MGCGVHAYFLLEWHLVMNPQEAREFGQRLRDRRESLGLTVRQVSDAAKVPHSTVARVERGEFAAPRPDKLAKLATALGFSPAELFAAAGYVRADELPELRDIFESKVSEPCPIGGRRTAEAIPRVGTGTGHRSIRGRGRGRCRRQWPMISDFQRGGARMISTPYSSAKKSGEVNPSSIKNARFSPNSSQSRLSRSWSL